MKFRMLSTIEVLDLLPENDIEMSNKYQDYRTCIYNTRKYLTDPMMPCSSVSITHLQQLLPKLPKNLYKGERLMLVDLLPQNRAELMVMIEEASSRFTEQEQEELLANLREISYSRPQDSDDEEE